MKHIKSLYRIVTIDIIKIRANERANYNIHQSQNQEMEEKNNYTITYSYPFYI